VGYTAAAKQAKADDLADTAADFVKRTWRLSADLIIPVPPSNVRSVQPVMLVATALSSRLGVPICNDCLKKVKETPQLKDIRDYDERKEVLDGAFAASAEFCAGKRLLLFDDLHGSGATVSHIVDVLKAAGAKSVSLLTLTSKK
jgi:predicted amidophosphoribosyltransferase